jgi:hypothetical protein
VATPEGQVLKAVCAYLDIQERLGRCWYWRQNNGGVWHPTRQIFLKPNGSGHKDGVPDIGLVIAGILNRLLGVSRIGKNDLRVV